MSAQLVWFITGTSSGLGRYLTLQALKRGDKVIASARTSSLSQLDDLKAQGADTIELDVTWSLERFSQTAEKAVAIHGRIDVLVNNAGYLLVGALEENTPEETFEQFNANVFGALNVTRAFLPYMRERKTGTIVWIGSVVGWITAPDTGVYGATKAAVRSLSDTLHAEISPIGLRSTCVDFGFFRTPVLDPGRRTPYVGRISDYKEITDKYESALQTYKGNQPGDPIKGCDIIVDVVRGEGQAEGKPFPTNLLLGSDAFNAVSPVLGVQKKNLEVWKEVTISTDLPKA
ncbi:hypothetical protein VKT23_009553 [Stygiomarasmius scandens]|uniref:NAD(P)-binding protein n=1 Tax=Marasmiellus scandens TaxID=2682957 RepID=A0ABR1JF22_9AGAR